MKLTFGENKIVIEGGMLKDKTGMCILSKSFETYDINKEHIYDIPVELHFKTKASLLILIEALKNIEKEWGEIDEE